MWVCDRCNELFGHSDSLVPSASHRASGCAHWTDTRSRTRAHTELHASPHHHMGMQRVLAVLCAVISASQASLPAGIGLYFTTSDLQGCPSGWMEDAGLQGRLLVGVTNGSLGGVVVGDALEDRSPPQHTHEWSTSMSLVPLARAEPGWRDALSRAACMRYRVVGVLNARRTHTPTHTHAL